MPKPTSTLNVPSHSKPRGHRAFSARLTETPGAPALDRSQPVLCAALEEWVIPALARHFLSLQSRRQIHLNPIEQVQPCVATSAVLPGRPEINRK